MKKILVAAVCFLALITAFDIWWNFPVSFFQKTEAADIVRIEVCDENNGNRFTVEDRSDIARIVDNIRGRSFTRDGIAAGYMGAGYTLKFYDGKRKCVEELAINDRETLVRSFYFYIDPREELCIDFLCELEVRLVGTWEETH